MMIKIENFSKRYGERSILKDLNLELPEKGVIALCGASGSGKTTLLNALGGIDTNYEGNITIKNYSFKDADEKSNREFRLKNIGYVFQNFNLFNLDTVLQNVLLPNECCSKLKRKLKKRRALDLIDAFNLGDKIKTPINQLSGGQKQRVAIARALINDPCLILADEPTGALDEKNSKEIYQILKKISKKSLVIIATHDIEGVKTIADLMITIESENIKIDKNIITKDEENVVALATGSFNKKSLLPLNFQFRHSFQKMKTKKMRTIIVNLVMSFALISVGATIIIKNSAQNKVSDVFSSVCRNDVIVMEPRKKTTNLFNGIYSASKTQTDHIALKYNQLLKGVGATYLLNFENFFKDRNEGYIYSTSYKYMLPALSARSINDFRILDKTFVGNIYPYLPDEEFKMDELMLGLSYDEMNKICLEFQIRRSYKSLGQYLKTNNVTIAFNFANNDWMYEDEQIFHWKYVTEAKKTCVYHTSSNWNEYIFETSMKLPSNDGTNKKFPWEMYKIYYLQTIEDPKVFLDTVLFDESLNDFIFERTNYSYHPLLCEPGVACEAKRVFVFYVDKALASPFVVKTIQANYKELNNFYFASPGGYATYGNGIMDGFSKELLLSFNENLLNDAIDASTSQYKDSELKIKFPKGVAQGNYLVSLNDGVKFSSNFTNLIKGRKPDSLNEIVVSKGLLDLLDSEFKLGMTLHLASNVNEEKTNDNKIYREYRKDNLNVVGCVDEDKPYIYHNNLWTISYFRDRLGVSNFLLSPTSVVFELNSNDINQVNNLVKSLNSNYHEYNFYNPVQTIANSMSQTLDYISKILIVFSIVSILIASLLQCVIAYLNMSESRNEITLFRYLGVNENDIASSFIVHALNHGLISFVISTFILIFMDLFMSMVLSKIIGGFFTLKIDFSIIIITLLVSLIMVLIVSIMIVTSLHYKNDKMKLFKLNFLLKKHY